MHSIKDVAKEAGVSIATVSHVINGTRYVSPDLTEKVHQAISKLNYRPHAIARSLRKNKTLTIGLVIPDNSNPFFSEILRGAEDSAFNYGYSVIVGNSDSDPQKELAYFKSLSSGKVDGLIFVDAALPDEYVRTAMSAQTPVIVVDRNLSEKAVDGIFLDNFRGGLEATEYLIQIGHRRIGCISGPSSIIPNMERVRGYRSALESYGIPVDDELIYEGDFQVDGGTRGALFLMNKPQPPSAIFCCNDMMAIGALQAFRQHGIRVPEDISLVGFDDIPQAAYAEPSLTTVAQPKYEIGQIAVDLLIQRLKGLASIEPQTILLQPALIIRSSSAMKSNPDI
jgi:LacI family transcriptional regulator